MNQMTLSITWLRLGLVEVEGAVAEGAEAEVAQKVEVAAARVERVAAAVVTTVVTTVMVKAAAAAKEGVRGSVPLQQEVRVRPPYPELAVEHRSLYPTDNHSQVALQAEEHED